MDKRRGLTDLEIRNEVDVLLSERHDTTANGEIVFKRNIMSIYVYIHIYIYYIAIYACICFQSYVYNIIT